MNGLCWALLLALWVCCLALIDPIALGIEQWKQRRIDRRWRDWYVAYWRKPE